MRAANDNTPKQAHIRFSVEPRLVPVAKAARRLHLTAREFLDRHLQFRAHGFPLPCPVTGHYDLEAIDRWIDQVNASPNASLSEVDFETRLARLG